MTAFLLNWRILLPLVLLSGLWLFHTIDKAKAVTRAETRTEARVSRELRLAYEEQARENARVSAVLRSKIAFRNMQIMKLKGKVRHALDKPDAVCWTPRAVCLLAQSRGYQCDATGSLPGPVPTASTP